MHEEILIPLVLFLSIAAVLIVYRKFMNEERIALIEKGVDANVFSRKKDSNANPVLRISLLLVGAGIGIFLASILEGMFRHEEAAYFSFILTFGGVGLLFAYLIEKKSDSKDN